MATRKEGIQLFQRKPWAKRQATFTSSKWQVGGIWVCLQCPHDRRKLFFAWNFLREYAIPSNRLLVLRVVRTDIFAVCHNDKWNFVGNAVVYCLLRVFCCEALRASFCFNKKLRLCLPAGDKKVNITLCVSLWVFRFSREGCSGFLSKAI